MEITSTAKINIRFQFINDTSFKLPPNLIKNPEYLAIKMKLQSVIMVPQKITISSTQNVNLKLQHTHLQILVQLQNQRQAETTVDATNLLFHDKVKENAEKNQIHPINVYKCDSKDSKREYQQTLTGKLYQMKATKITKTAYLVTEIDKKEYYADDLGFIKKILSNLSQGKKLKPVKVKGVRCTPFSTWYGIFTIPQPVLHLNF